MRFFMRAITNYDEGLQKHPGTFDLAYNKYVKSALISKQVIILHFSISSMIERYWFEFIFY